MGDKTASGNYWDRGISRRRLIAAGGAGIAVAGIAACSSSNSTTNNAPANKAAVPAASAPASTSAAAPASTRATAAAGASATARATQAAAAPSVTPRKGGTLVVGATNDMQLTQGWPFGFPGGAVSIVQFGSMETLVSYVDSLQPTLRLADRFEYNADRSAVTIGLRQGPKFFNGVPVTPEDVILGIDVINNPAKYKITGNNSQLATFARSITNYLDAKVDDHTLHFTFSQPIVNMTDFFAQLLVTQASSFQKLMSGTEIQGTGPYQLTKWNPGQGLHLSPNPNWWDKARTGGPYLDGIDVRLYADNDALSLAFQAGEVDVSYMQPPNIAAQFLSKNQVHIGSRHGVTYLGSNVTSPLLTDARVRQAIDYALDRQTWLKDHGEGFYKLTVQPWPATSPAFDPALEAAFYDPQKSKQLLQAAGFTQSQPVSIEYTATFQDAAAPAFLQAQLEAVGIKTQLVLLEYGAYIDHFTQKNFKDLYLHSHSFGDISPVSMMSSAVPYQLPNDQGVGGGATHYNSPAYRDLFAKLQTLDPLSDGAKAQYKIFNNLMQTDCWIAPYSESLTLDLLSTKVKGHDKYWITILGTPDYGGVWKTA